MQKFKPVLRMSVFMMSPRDLLECIRFGLNTLNAKTIRTPQHNTYNYAPIQEDTHVTHVIDAAACGSIAHNLSRYML